MPLNIWYALVYPVCAKGRSGPLSCTRLHCLSTCAGCCIMLATQNWQRIPFAVKLGDEAQMDIDYTFAQMLYLCIAPRTAPPKHVLRVAMFGPAAGRCISSHRTESRPKISGSRPQVPNVGGLNFLKFPPRPETTLLLSWFVTQMLACCDGQLPCVSRCWSSS